MDRRTPLSRLARCSAAAVLFGVVAACGASTALDTGAGGSGGASTATSTGTTGTTVTTTTGGTVGTGMGVGGAGATTVTTTGGATTGGATTGVGGGSPVPVACDGAPCQLGQICCYNPTGPGDHCGTAGQCESGYVELLCSSPTGCPGAICCATLDPTHTNIEGTSCQTTCGQADELVVCTPMQPPPCGNGLSCQPSQDLGPGYSLCE